MKTSTRIIDYDLKGCMEGGFYEIRITGSNIAGWGDQPSTLVLKTSILTPKNLKISNDNRHFYSTSHEKYPFWF